MVPLLLSTLACNAAAQLTAPHHTNELKSTSPSTTASEFEAACSALLPEILSAARSGGSGTLSTSFDDAQEVRYLVVYDLNGDDLGSRDDLLLPEELDEELDSRASHEDIWAYFTALIPAEQRSFVTEFSILSDGPHNILAGVSPTYDDPSEWTLKVDVVDADDPYALTYSLLHEFGHFLTLNASQVPPDDRVFFHPEDHARKKDAVASCPRYFTGEGCSNPGSYINEFFTRYWSSFGADRETTHPSSEQDGHHDLAHDFFLQHRDQFLTPYAATSPQEDMAESWAYFILSPKPEPISIANQKILFFYEYPELVDLQEQILNRLCTSFPQN